MKKSDNKTFVSGLVWNYGSIAVLALGGLVFSGIIMLFYDAAVLGVFNQVYAYYLLLSQVSVFGVHASVLKHVSECPKDAPEARHIFSTGLAAGGLTTLATEALLVAALFIAGTSFPGPVVDGVWTLVPALPFLTFNKIALFYLNGRSEMKAYAVFQALRNVFVALALAALALAQAPGGAISLSFAIAEALLFLCTLLYLLGRGLLGRGATAPRSDAPGQRLAGGAGNRLATSNAAEKKGWLKKHLTFGLHILPGNLVLEFNSKIDILCLGWVLGSDTVVGWYSFASLFTEGFYQVFVVVRRSLNPQIARAKAVGTLPLEYAPLKAKLKRWLRPAGLPAAALLVGAYYLLCAAIGRQEYLSALWPLAIIVASIALNSRSIVMGNLLAQTGHPKHESIVNLATTIVNLCLNFAFIALWGMMGAAVATALSYFAFTLLLRRFAKSCLGIKL